MNGNKFESWQIMYSSDSEASTQAVKLLSAELGKYLIREKDVYTLYVLPCVKERENIEKNSVIIGNYYESRLINRFVKENDIPDNGFLIGTVKDESKNQLVVITAKKTENLYYAAAAFVDDFIEKYAPLCGTLKMSSKFFDYDIEDNVMVSSPKINVRSVFTWGLPINDYRKYVRDIARCKVNRLIIWNDYAPVNAKEIMEYAHKFNIELIWGFSWGWNELIWGGLKQSKSIDAEFISNLKSVILEKYEKEYKDISGDGIYFQSFTELDADTIGGTRISSAVTSVVNEVSALLLEKYPTLNIIFGLHASSVKTHLEDIEKVDRRIEILWEDWGSFPAYYIPSHNEEEYEETYETTKKILALRNGTKLGFLFKGFMTLDWSRFKHHDGPFVLGENLPVISENDASLRKCAWKSFQAGWVRYGKYAKEIAELIYKTTGGNVELGMAGVFDGGVWLPEAICTELMWDPERDFDDVLFTSMVKNSVRFE
ncbi:MAG: hypothetical protein ACI4SC_04020 [Candidatus Neoclostridium sp.]